MPHCEQTIPLCATTSTIHAAVLRPITEGAGNMTARALNPLIYGADGAGGMAGMLGGIFGRQDPVKTATDQNTLATRQNSEAVYLLAALWARTAGIPRSPRSISAPCSPVSDRCHASPKAASLTAPVSSANPGVS